MRSAALIRGSKPNGVVAANERMTTWLRGHQTLKYVGTDDYVPVRLIDFAKPGNNTLVVSDEVTFGAPGHERRFDIVLWVNGLPLVVGETKTPVERDEVVAERRQRRPRRLRGRGCPRSSLRTCLSFATEGREFHYGAVGQPPEHWLLWGVHRRTRTTWTACDAGPALGGAAAHAGAGAVDPAGLHPVRPAQVGGRAVLRS